MSARRRAPAKCAMSRSAACPRSSRSCSRRCNRAKPAGIGGEIALMAWLRRSQGVPPFFVIDDPDRLARLAAMLGWTVPLRAVAGPEEAAGCFHEALGVLPRRLAHPVLMGRPDAA